METRGIIDMDDVAKPNSNINFASVKNYMSDKKEDELNNKNTNSSSGEEPEQKINLLEFSRLYKICEIPIINFVIVYIILYCLNCLHFDYDFKIILVAAVPITLIFSMISNPMLNMSISMMIVLIITIILVISGVSAENN